MTDLRPARHAQHGWYPADPDDLRRFMREACASDAPAEPALAVVSPHAGYRYSGGVAGAAFGRVEVTETVVVIGVSHRFARTDVSVGTAGRWAVPGGEVSVDCELANAILDRTPGAEADSGEQAVEHSLEVQVPFLAYRRPEVRIVPVQIGHLDLEGCRAVGGALASVLGERGDPTLVVASTDMHHQEQLPGVRPSTRVAELDALAIERIEALDPEGLFDIVRREEIGMCGVRPTTISLYCSMELGASTVVPVRHATSHEVTGDEGYVVGYYSALIR